MKNETAVHTNKLGGDSRDSLGEYLASLRRFEVLPPEEFAQVAREMRAAERCFRAAIVRVPGTSLLALDRWNERRALGLVTGLLSERHRDEPERDWSAIVDAVMERLSEIVTRDAPDSNEVAELLESAQLRIDLLEEITREILAERSSRTAVESESLAEAQAALETRRERLQTMTAHNLRLVVKLAKSYRHRGVPFADLIQDGNIGLMRAAEKFDPERGFRFSSYAIWWIEQSLVRSLQRDARTVRVPSHVLDAQNRYRDAERELRSRTGGATHAELAAACGIDSDQEEKIAASMRPIESLDDALYDDGELSRGDRLANPEETDPSDAIDVARVRSAFAAAFRKLKPRERKILGLRFGLKGEERTLQGIADVLGLSRERVRQIQNRAIAKLREQDRIAELRHLVETEEDNVAPRLEALAGGGHDSGSPVVVPLGVRESAAA